MPRPIDPESWDTNFQLLVEYQSENKTNSTTNHRKGATPSTSEPGVGKWVSHQRSNYRAGTLSLDRIAKLNSINFIWDGQKKANATAAAVMLELPSTKVPTPSTSSCSANTTGTSVTKLCTVTVIDRLI